MESRDDMSIAFNRRSVVSSWCQLTAVAIAYVIANHRVGFSKPCLQAPKFIVDSLSAKSKFGNLNAPFIPLFPPVFAIMEQPLIGLADRIFY